MATFNGILPSAQSQQTQRTQTYRTLSYKYGSGYEGRTPDGANAAIDTWTLSWDNLTATQATLLETWLLANPPTVQWQGDGTLLPSTNTYWMTKDGYQKTPLPGNVWSFQMNCEQAF